MPPEPDHQDSPLPLSYTSAGAPTGRPQAAFAAQGGMCSPCVCYRNATLTARTTLTCVGEAHGSCDKSWWPRPGPAVLLPSQSYQANSIQRLHSNSSSGASEYASADGEEELAHGHMRAGPLKGPCHQVPLYGCDTHMPQQQQQQEETQHEQLQQQPGQEHAQRQQHQMQQREWRVGCEEQARVQAPDVRTSAPAPWHAVIGPHPSCPCGASHCSCCNTSSGHASQYGAASCTTTSPGAARVGSSRCQQQGDHQPTSPGGQSAAHKQGCGCSGPGDQPRHSRCLTGTDSSHHGPSSVRHRGSAAAATPAAAAAAAAAAQDASERSRRRQQQEQRSPLPRHSGRGQRGWGALLVWLLAAAAALPWGASGQFSATVTVYSTPGAFDPMAHCLKLLYQVLVQPSYKWVARGVWTRGRRRVVQVLCSVWADGRGRLRLTCMCPWPNHQAPGKGQSPTQYSGRAGFACLSCELPQLSPFPSLRTSLAMPALCITRFRYAHAALRCSAPPCSSPLRYYRSAPRADFDLVYLP